MPRGKRIPTTERGIFVVEGRSRSTGEPDRFFYVRYYTADHKLVEDCIGSASRGMTLSKAKKERIKRLSGKISNSGDYKGRRPRGPHSGDSGPCTRRARVANTPRLTRTEVTSNTSSHSPGRSHTRSHSWLWMGSGSGWERRKSPKR
jgi:hypothetical protein